MFCVNVRSVPRSKHPKSRLQNPISQRYSLCSEIHTDHITAVYWQTLKLLKLGCACNNRWALKGEQCFVWTVYFTAKPE